MGLGEFEIVFWIFGAAVLAGLIKVAFWLFVYWGLFKQFRPSTPEPLFNPFAAMLGVPQPLPESPEQRIARLRADHAARYEMRGLIFAMTFLIIGVVLVIFGFGTGEISIATGSLKLNHAGPGVVVIMAGVLIIKYTAHRGKFAE